MSASRRFPRSRFQPGIAAMYACTGASPSAFAICGLPPERRTTAPSLRFRALIGWTLRALGFTFAPAFGGDLRLMLYRFFADRPFRATAALTSALNAPAS